MKLLTWEQDGGEMWVAQFGARRPEIRFEVYEYRGHGGNVWVAQQAVGPNYTTVDRRAPDEAAAKDACEHWLRDWLGEAGTAAMLAGARMRLQEMEMAAAGGLRMLGEE